ncbi:hypothetical protein B0T26DRAFT_748969 [Lasiosphaeria miniovina]|uniref:Uncharacterized protein n=1 Tax=Lasiosphaeria miniovina TaxID=1954250 RepID=A0AA40EAY5_9PEZI|nr:uncharacterized protein B0T26DRAFT_748969 [Lasiosphaeria miniovina]KAK0728808.1 hypothetical protein B0T26DRAFT_748969 [Lasiosphaeria miniovina]
MGVLVGSVLPDDMRCPAPASTCRWPDYTTLAICSDLRDVTKLTTSECKTEPHATESAGTMSCTFQSPGMRNLTSPLTMTFNSSTPSIPNSEDVAATPSIISATDTRAGGVDAVAMNLASEEADFTTQIPPRDRATISGQSAAPESSEVPAGSSDLRYYQANSTSATMFTTDNNSETNLWMFLQYSMTVSRVSGERNPANFHFIHDPIHVFGDWDGFAQNMDAALTNLISGDNAQATALAGTAYATVPTRVLFWQWLSLPLAETLLVAALLGVTIAVSRNMPP